MASLAHQLSLYEQLEALPDGLIGEILNAQLHTQPRPAGPHALAGSNLNSTIGSRYGLGDGGPGGWWILMEPEVHLIRDQEVAVPDLAGWRRERMPRIPDGHRFEVVPDWVCEILSPTTASKDREVKLPLYAHYGVAYAWLLDPQRRTFEAYGLAQGQWRLLLEAADDATVQAAPFGELVLKLSTLWVETT